MTRTQITRLLLIAVTSSFCYADDGSFASLCKGWKGDGHSSIDRAVSNDHKHWRWGKDNNIVPWDMESYNLKDEDKLVFQEAMDYIESLSCVKFVKKVNQQEFLRFERACENMRPNLGFDHDDCEPGSWVDNLDGKGRLELATSANLVSGHYYYRGHIAHELLHVLGHAHTQKRDDRDKYITIYMDNVWPGTGRYQYKECVNCDDHDTPYDCMSVMHYRNGAFAIDDSKPTMVAKDSSTCDLNSDNSYLTWSDIDLLNTHYECSEEQIPFMVSGQGQLSSSGFDHNYKTTRKMLQVKEGHTIQILWNSFNIYGYVKVVDGNGEILMDKTRGTTLPAPIQSATNRLHIDQVIYAGNYELTWLENDTFTP